MQKLISPKHFKGSLAGLLFACAFCLCHQTAAAQPFKRTAVASYNVDNGLLQNTVQHMVVDSFGFVWFSTDAGLQRFDGQQFQSIDVPGYNLTSYNPAGIALQQNGEVWISHAGGISAYNPLTNRMRTVYNQPAPLINYPYTKAGEDAQAVWYIAYPQGLLRFHKQSGALLKQVALPQGLIAPKGSAFSFYPLDKQTSLLASDDALTVFNAESGTFGRSFKLTGLLNGVTPLGGQRVLYACNGYFHRLHLATGRQEPPVKMDEALQKDVSMQLLKTTDGRLLMGHLKNVYELDTVTLAIKTKWAAFNQDQLLNSGGISRMYLDRFNRLWIMTNSDGVKQMSMARQPFAYYGTAVKERNFARTIHVEKQNNRILSGAYEGGLSMFDTAGQLTGHWPVPGGSATSVIDIMPLTTDQYLVLTMGQPSLWAFSIKTGKASPLITDPAAAAMRSSYYGHLHPLGGNRFLFLDHAFIRFRVAGGRLIDTVSLRPYSIYSYNLCQTKSNEYCIASYEGLEFTDTAFHRLRFVPFTHSIVSRCMAVDEAGRIWLGTENGLYKFEADGKLIKKYTAADGLTDAGIYAIEPFNKGIYFSHNKGLSFLSADGRLSHHNRTSGLQENEFNTKSSFKTSDGQLFFGGINGVSAFYHRNLVVEEKPPAIYITGLEVMDKPWRDTAAWNIRELSVPHDAARIALRIGAPAAAGNVGYLYEYRMEGLEPDWIPSSGDGFIRYSLRPGAYIFKARVSGTGGSTETMLRIKVAAPWWLRPWFLITAAVVIIGAVAFGVNRYNHNKYRERIKQLEMESRLQAERERISRDLHDNLGAYASAITDNVDKLQKTGPDPRRMKSLKDNAAEIMAALRDTIWALNKSQVSAISLSDRIKSHLQKMREAYPAVTIELTEQIDTAALLSPEGALNVLRIVQEAFHNAVKHSRGNRIDILLHIGQRLHITIRDNGIGLPPRVAETGYGLRNMKTRAAESNLRLRITPVDGSGTLVELSSSIP